MANGPRSFVKKENTPAITIPTDADRDERLRIQNIRERIERIEAITGLVEGLTSRVNVVEEQMNVPPPTDDEEVDDEFQKQLDYLLALLSSLKVTPQSQYVPVVYSRNLEDRVRNLETLLSSSFVRY